MPFSTRKELFCTFAQDLGVKIISFPVGNITIARTFLPFVIIIIIMMMMMMMMMIKKNNTTINSIIKNYTVFY